MQRPRIVIVTPALADANNGNWQTARRWAAMLRADYGVRVLSRWSADAAADEVLMLALHARRSAESVAAWRAQRPAAPLVLVMTGTDLYRDIATDAAAQRSLALADRLVVLNTRGAQALPAELRAKARVVLQSTPARRPQADKTTRHLRALAVGHLRAEKAPQTLWAAAARLAQRGDILIDQLGAALDPALGEQASRLAQQLPGFRWLAAVPHAQARRRIQAAHVLVHTSAMEGGAHVVTEAITSGTPVLASRIDGNLGLLGDDYAGCFDPGDDAALAALLVRARDDAAMLPALAAQCAARAPLFAPRREHQRLLQLLAELGLPPTRTPLETLA